MNYYLYGFIETSEAKDFGPIGFEMGGQGEGSVVACSNQNLAAVVGPAPQESFEGFNKATLVKALLAHQETLETIMKIHFILPCKFGTVLKDKQEVNQMLSQNGESLAQWLHKMRNRFEIDVVVTWDTRLFLNEIAARDPEIVELKKHWQSLPLADQERGKLSLGMLLSAKLKEQAKHYAEDILTVLKGVSESYAVHGVMNDEMVFNASFLLTRCSEDLFFRALEGLDKRWEGRLNFKCVGPLPPYSFATVTLRRFDPKKIRWAKKTLGLKGFINLDQVKRAYKNRARQCHPDTHSQLDQKAFETVHQAYELLVEYYQGGCKPMKVSLFNVNGDTR